MIVLLGCSVVSSSYASGLLQKLGAVHKKDAQHVKATVHQSLHSGNLSDFANDWEGTCVISGEDPEDIELSIDSQENIITIDGDDYELGVFKTQSSSNEFGTDFFHIAIDWNENGKQLDAHVNYVWNQNGTASGFSGTGKTTFELVNGQLIIKSDSRAFRDMQETSETTTCTLSPAR